MIEVCYGCGKEMEWAVDDYTHKWTLTEGAEYKVMPFCHGCASKDNRRDSNANDSKTV